MILPVIDNSLMQYSVLSVVIPLLGAFLLPVLDRVSNMAARALGPAIMLICFGLVVKIWLQIEQPMVVALGGFAAPLGVVFYIDQLSLLFNAMVLIIAFVLWPFQASASIREHSLMLLLSGAACGLALSGDLFNIYVFYELVSVASFGLVTAKGNRSCYAAAIRYIFISGFGTVLALTGTALVYTQTGTLNLAHLALVAPIQLNNNAGLVGFALILIGIGVKAELFPVNTWVPEVYATASKRVSALLAGLVSKLAVLVLLRMMVLVFHTEQAYQLVLVLGMLTVVSGELAAWRSPDMSRMLAFSSIGQLGLIFIAFSIPGQQGMFAGIALSLHHMLVKPALFLIAERWGHALKNLSGAAKKSPLAALLFILFAMSLIGIPPLPGFWAKLLTVTALITMQSPLYSFALLVMLVTTVIEANYLFRVIIGFYDKPQTDIPAHKPLSFATSALFAVVLIIAAIFIAPLGDQLNTTAQQAANRDLYITTVFPGVRN